MELWLVSPVWIREFSVRGPGGLAAGWPIRIVVDECRHFGLTGEEARLIDVRKQSG